MIKEAIKKDNEIIIYTENSNNTMTFLTPVMKFIILENSILVLTNTDRKTYGDRNIFRLSEEGEILWQVEQPDKFRGIDANRTVCFTGLSIEVDKIRAYSLNGFDYEIDFETGKLLSKVYTK